MALPRPSETGAQPAATGRSLRVLLADDHPVVRRGLEVILHAEPDIEVIAQVANITAVKRGVRELAPDVLVLDLNMPGGASLEAIPGLRRDAPATEIVVLTMQEDPSIVRAALAAGAKAYVLKEAADTELVAAIRRAAAGESYINRQLAGRLAKDRLRHDGWD